MTPSHPPAPARPRPQKLIWLTVATVAALCVLVGLGGWQLQRKDWKDDLLARFEERVDEAPVALEVLLARQAGGEDIRYARVELTGHYLSVPARRLYDLHDAKPVWRIMVPFAESGGRIVLVDRGVVAFEARYDDGDHAPPDGGDISLTGRLRQGDTPGLFTPDNNPSANEWYWREIDAMLADATSYDAPVISTFLIEHEPPAATPLSPQPAPADLSAVSNRHFEYALTWFGLAAALLGVYAAFVRTRSRP